MARTENLVILLGRLGDDPEVRYTQSNTAVANLSVATNRRYKDNMGEWQEETEWHRVVVWDNQAENCQKYLKKGDLVYLKGSLQTRKWEDRDGNTRYTTEIKAFMVNFLNTGQSDGQKGDRSAEEDVGPVDSDTDLNDKFDDIDDDLPF